MCFLFMPHACRSWRYCADTKDTDCVLRLLVWAPMPSCVFQDMELEDAVHTALLTLKEGFEGQISGENIEVAVVGEDQKFRVLTPAEVSDYLEEVE